MQIKFKLLHPDAKLPTRAHDTDACFDVVAVSRSEVKDGIITYGLGFSTEMPEWWAGYIHARSSIRTTDLLLANGVAVIDADYRGEWMVSFRVCKQDEGLGMFGVMGGFKAYEIGSRIAQIRFAPLPNYELVVADELSDTQRGAGGFGSTGK